MPSLRLLADDLTGALDKEALNEAGYHYPGHTDMLAAFTGVRGSVMLLAHGNMRVSHVSTHVALQDVPARLTPERLAGMPKALQHPGGTTCPSLAWLFALS